MISVSLGGVLWLHVEIAGRPATRHAHDGGTRSRRPSHRGALRALEVELNDSPPPPYHVFATRSRQRRRIRGGDWPSTVAAECTLSCRLALFPGQDVPWLQARVEEAVATATAAHGFLAAHPPRVRYDGFACAGTEISAEHALVTTLSESYARVEGAAPELVPTTATTDARLFLLEGNPGGVLLGPRAESVHAVDERVNIPSMITAAQVLAVFIRDWCGVSSARARTVALQSLTARRDASPVPAVREPPPVSFATL